MSTRVRGHVGPARPDPRPTSPSPSGTPGRPGSASRSATSAWPARSRPDCGGADERRHRPHRPRRGGRPRADLGHLAGRPSPRRLAGDLGPAGGGLRRLPGRRGTASATCCWTPGGGSWSRHPHDVIQVSFLDPFNLRELLSALWLSTRVAFTGLAIAIVLGLALAVAMNRAKWIERSIYPYAVLTQTIPILAMVPLLRLLVRLRRLQPGPGRASSSPSSPSSPTPCSACSRWTRSTTTCSPCTAPAGHQAVEAGAPDRPAVDLHRAADLRRARRHRGDRRPTSSSSRATPGSAS